MGERRWIDHDSPCHLPCLVNPVDDFILTIALVEANVEVELLGYLATLVFDVGKGLMAVDMWLTLAQEIEVWTIQDIDKTVHEESFAARYKSTLILMRRR